MALIRDRIGEFQFAVTKGTPQSVRWVLDMWTNPGAQGIGIARTAYVGKAYTLETMTDVADMAAADGLRTQYEAAVGTGPWWVDWANIRQIAQVYVLDVIVHCQACYLPVGGLTDGAGLAMVVATWKLQPVLPA